MVRGQRPQPDARRRPSTIRFTQDSIQRNFKDGRSCLELYDDIKNKDAAVSDIPAVRVAEKDGLFYSSNNRRLYVFRALEYDGIIDYIWVKMIHYEDINKGHKITTKNKGESVKVRGCNTCLPHSIAEIEEARRERKRRSQPKNTGHASGNPITNIVASPHLRRNTSEKKNINSTISRFDYTAPRQLKKTPKQIRHRPTRSPVNAENRYLFFDDLRYWNTYHNRVSRSYSKDDDPESYWWKLIAGGCAAAVLYFFVTRSETNPNENVPGSIIPDLPDVPQLPPATTADTLLAGDRVNGDLSFPFTQSFGESVDATQTGILASMFSGSITVLGYGFSLICWTRKQVIFLIGRVIGITPPVLTKAGSLLGSVVRLTARVVFDAASVLFRSIYYIIMYHSTAGCFHLAGKTESVMNNRPVVIRKVKKMVHATSAILYYKPYRKNMVEDKKLKPREKWRSNIDFFFGVAGGSVGLGNVWRFPYLCYKNGGGAFLIPYLFFLITAALPIFFLEVTVGQFTSRGVARAWEMIPLMKGIGYASTTIIVNLNIYYMTVLAWALRYTIASFSTTLPWGSCDHDWNSNNCFVFDGNISASEEDNLTETFNSTQMTPYWNSSLAMNISSGNESTRVSSVIEFWERGVLGLSSGVHELGSVQLELLACMAIGWIVVYFSIWRGIGWTSKVVYFTATFPLVMLLVLFVRGITLPGAMDGIEYYLKPNITKLGNPQVWVDAATQVFYSYSLCNGIIIALGSYNTYHHNSYRDSILLAFLNSGTSFFSGFVVFTVLGYMAKEQGIHIDSVADSGPGLVFIAYPKAISLLPLPQLWGVLFFLMLFFLGLDSQFVGQESFIASLVDMRPRFFQKPWRREIVVAIICGVQFLIGIIMITRGGVYVFNMYDNYAAAGWCLFFIGICECVTIAWLFGINRYWNRVIDMLGYAPRFPLFKYCWAFVAPVTTLAVFFYSLVKYTPLTYNKTYVYPLWAQFLAWCLALCAILWIPGYALYVLCKAEGSLSERWRVVTSIPREVEKRLFREDERNGAEKFEGSDSLLEKKDLADESLPKYSSVVL